MTERMKLAVLIVVITLFTLGIFNERKKILRCEESQPFTTDQALSRNCAGNMKNP